jgi:molecular chaperone DnaK (HSP70)
MSRLSSGKLDHLAKENEHYESEDGVEAERLQTKNGLETYVTEFRNSMESPTLDKKAKAGDKAKLYSQIVDIMGWLESSSFASHETYARKRQELEDVAIPIIGRI